MPGLTSSKRSRGTRTQAVAAGSCLENPGFPTRVPDKIAVKSTTCWVRPDKSKDIRG